LLAAALAMTLALAACEKDTPVETAIDNTKDALDARDHEKLKDAAEDVKEGVENAADDLKDAAKDPKN
jgi:hypothetical protein